MTFDTVLKTARLSLRDPRAGLRVVFSWNLSLAEGAIALGLMAIVSAVLASLVMIVPPDADPVSGAVLSNPLYLALVQCVGLGLIAVFLHLLGRVGQSTACLPQAVVMMAWVEALWIAITVVEIVAVILLPPLGVILLVAGTMLSLWLLVNFVAEMHGFQSLFLTLLGVIAAFFAAMFAAVVLLMALLLLGIIHV